MPLKTQLIVAWCTALNVGDVAHRRMYTHVAQCGSVVQSSESELRVGRDFATVERAVFTETDGVGHLVF